MNKSELIAKLAEKAGITKKAAAKVLDAWTELIGKSLAAGKKVTISGFGVFDVSQRAARTGRNPRTGAPIQIPAMKVPRFRAGKRLKSYLR